MDVTGVEKRTYLSGVVVTGSSRTGGTSWVQIRGDQIKKRNMDYTVAHLTKVVIYLTVSILFGKF